MKCPGSVPAVSSLDSLLIRSDTETTKLLAVYIKLHLTNSIFVLLYALALTVEPLTYFGTAEFDTRPWRDCPDRGIQWLSSVRPGNYGTSPRSSILFSIQLYCIVSLFPAITVSHSD